MTIWDDIDDILPVDTVLLIIGTAATAGAYGGVVGILTSAQSVALQEGMKTLANLTLQGKNPLEANWADAWAGQTVTRMKLAGDVVFEKIKTWAKNTEYGKKASDTWDAIKKEKTNFEQKRAKFLAALRAECRARFPDPAIAERECRDDVLALAANYHVRENVFNTHDWSPTTGKPIRQLGKAKVDATTLTKRPYTLAQLDQIWRDAEARGMPSAIVQALKNRYTIERHKRLMAFESGTLARPIPVVLPEEVGERPAREVDISMPGGAPGGAAGKTWLGELTTALVLTSPVWIPIFALPWWKSRRKARK